MRSTILALLLIGCAGAQASPEACLAPKLLPIESRYLREAILACDGEEWAMCPEREQLEAKYDKQRQAAVEACK